MSLERIFKLQCQVQHYPWGGRQHGNRKPYIAKLLNAEAGDQPFAELWVGAHPSLPAKADCDGFEVALDKFIAGNPEQILGKELVEQGVAALPFLLKVLNCEQPLSIQAHPGKELAAELHSRDPRNYPDPEHKPELAVALTEFDALAGFRPPAEIQEDMARIKPLGELFARFLDQRHSGLPEWLREAFSHIYVLPAAEAAAAVAAIAAELRKLEQPQPRDKWFLKASELFPGDRGALAMYFLNLLHLNPGEAFFMGPNQPHAYLQGTIIECMANSDNVVRAGLTKKFIDTDTLLEMLDYKPGAPEVSRGRAVRPGVTAFRVPAAEFLVEFWTLGEGEETSCRAEGAPSLLLVVEGEAELKTDNDAVPAAVGTAWFWPAALDTLDATGSAARTRIVRATSNHRRLDLQKQEAAPAVKLPSAVVEQAAPADFNEAMDRRQKRFVAGVRIGARVSGKVTAIDRKSVFIDLNAKSEGIIERNQLVDADGKLTVKVGDTVEAYCISARDGEFRLAMRMGAGERDSSLQDAHEAGIPVEGKVEAECKGGYEVTVNSTRAFCPYSQMDLFRKEPENYIGQRFSFLVGEFEEEGRSVVLNRRALLEKEREQQIAEMKEKLRPGDTVQGTVRKIMPFGVFVDIGCLDGLVPMSELAWGHVEDATSVVHEGQTVKVVVKSLDWDKQRFSLSIKQALPSPWEDIQTKYPAGRHCSGKIVKLMPFGAFVALEPGIEGLVHISKLGAGRRISHPQEVVAVGDQVEVVVEAVDPEQRRLSLAIEASAGPAIAPTAVTAGTAVEVGTELDGKVESIKDFGVFVKLNDKQTGLLHVSQIELTGSANRMRAMFDKFPPGSDIKVVVKEIKGDRISLTLRETLERASEEVRVEDYQDSAGKSLGSLGDLFSGLKL